MNDNLPASTATGVSEDVTAMRRAGSSRREPRETSIVASAGAGVIWVGLLAAGVLSLAPIAQTAAKEFQRYSLVQAEPGVIRGLIAQPRAGADAVELETMSELALLVEAGHEPKALEFARQAVAANPDRPFVWARIAWLETEASRSVTPATLEALEKSMQLCPLCDEELIRWRFNFVLGHWRQIPDPLRRKAFDHADILRWRGENAEFLAEMRAKATHAGIPFDAYRAAVDTPVRSRDIGPLAANKTAAR